jgi:hypothetical protein
MRCNPTDNSTRQDVRTLVRLHRFVAGANVALRLLYETRDSPDKPECKQYEIYRANTTAFSSLTKREFHASHPEEADGDVTAAVQSEKNFSHSCQGRQAWK